MALTADQLKFLAARLLTKADKEAAISAGVHPVSVSRWKAEDPEFLDRYNGIFEDGIVLAKDILRQHLGKSAQRVAEALDATVFNKPDHKNRVAAAKLAFQVHGLLKDTVEHTGKDGALLAMEVVIRQLEQQQKQPPP